MYVDPGGWSLVLQALIGMLVAVPVLVGIYWGRIRTFFSRRKGDDKKGD